MADCGCGCGGAGNCNDNLDSISKNAQVSGNINYDGTAFTCAENSAIDVANGEGLNAILQKILAQLCSNRNGGNYTFNASDKILVTNANSGSIVKATTGFGVVKRSEGLRVLIGGSFNSITDVAGIDIDLRLIAKDSAGIESSTPIQTFNIPFSTVANRIKIEMSLSLNSATDVFTYTFESSSEVDTIEYVYSNEIALPAPYSTHNDIGLEVQATVNGADQILFNNIIFEHLR